MSGPGPGEIGGSSPLNMTWQDGLVQASAIDLLTGYPLKMYFQIPLVFPVWLQFFPVPNYIICEYYIHRTDLADLSSFWKKMDFFATWANKIPCVFPVFKQNSLCFPCVLTTFPNSLCFPWQGYFLAIFPVFPLPWVRCTGQETTQKLKMSQGVLARSQRFETYLTCMSSTQYSLSGGMKHINPRPISITLK